MVDYVVNGITYNVKNIREYMKKDYWDADDLKFDFWFRLLRHQEIFNKVMELNGLVKSNYAENDNTEILIQQMIEKNKNVKPIELNLDF